MKKLSSGVCIVLLGVVLGCSEDDDGARVIPESGVNEEQVSYVAPSNSMAYKFDVPTSHIAGADPVPAELPDLKSQKVGYPIEITGAVKGVPGGIVTARFYRKGTRTADGRGTITNEFGTTMQSQDDSKLCSYTLRGKVPATAESHDVEILLSYPIPAKDQGERKFKLKRVVIAKGELTTEE